MEQMSLVEVFQVLGIAQTKDEGAIKGAYREKLAVTNPEDNPEGFKRLRMAYEEAIRYAGQEEEEMTQERDTTPSGLWVEKASKIYENIHTRCDKALWEELFSEDIFLSLEEEENCRTKLLIFLMDHFRLPTEIWKLLDEKMHIIKDAEQLRESFASDFISYVISKCERGEDINFEYFTGEDCADYDLFFQYYDHAWQALEAGDLKQVEEYLKNADDLGITHPAMEICRAYLLEKQEKKEEALKCVKALYERYPRDGMVCFNTAELLWRNEGRQEAAELYKALKEESDTHYMANVRLTEWYYEAGEYKLAKKCAEKVLSFGADDNFLELLGKINKELEKDLERHYREEKDWETALELCWCYLQDGRVSKGIMLARSLEGKVSLERDAEYKGLMAKLHIEVGDYEKAVSMAEIWEKALEQKIERDETKEEKEKDIDRIRQSHLIRMQCYRYIAHGTDVLKEGKSREYFEKSIREAEIMEEGSSKDISILLEKAQIYMEMEEYEKSLEVTRYLVERYRVYAAYATEAEVYRRKWEAGGVVQASRQCINAFPSYIRAYEHMAKVYLDLERIEDLEKVLEEAKQNGVESVILDAYRYQINHKVPETEELNKNLQSFRRDFLKKVENGEFAYYEHGLPILTEYLYMYPGTYMLVERGLFHRAAHKLDEAQKDFEKAIAENPYHPYALNGLSFTYKYKGDFDKALIFMKRTIRYRDEDMSPISYADMASLYSLLGDYELAEESYRKYMELTDGGSDYHKRRMAFALARCNKFEEAEALLLACNEGKKTSQFYDDVIDVYQRARKEDEAWKALNEWNLEIGAELKGINKLVSHKKTDRNALPDYFCRKAWQELMFGDKQNALKYFDEYSKINQSIKKKDVESVLCDIIFACIVCGDSKRGMKYAKLLQGWMKMESMKSSSSYHDRQKAFLQLRFLAGYYFMKDEELQAILDRDAKTEICHFCDCAVCKEMESVHVLYLMKIGKKEEAIQRMKRDLERFPQDEYMIAIEHNLL